MTSRSCSSQQLPSRRRGTEMLLRGILATILLSPYVFAGVSVPDWVKQAAKEKVDVPADSKAVVLLDNEEIAVRENGETITHYRRVVKILRPQGRDYAIPFVGIDHEQKLLSLHAWSISPKGDEYELKEKDFLEHGDFGEELYSDIRVKAASPPA